MSHIKVAELKSVKDNKTPIKADDVLSIGEDIVKIFPSGVNLKNIGCYDESIIKGHYVISFKWRAEKRLGSRHSLLCNRQYRCRCVGISRPCYHRYASWID